MKIHSWDLDSDNSQLQTSFIPALVRTSAYRSFSVTNLSAQDIQLQVVSSSSLTSKPILTTRTNTMEAQLPKMSFNNEATNTGSLNHRTRTTRYASGGRTVSALNIRNRDISAGSTLSKMSIKDIDDIPAALGASITIGNASDQDTPVTQYATVRNDVQAEASPTRAHSPRVLPLAAITSPLQLRDGSFIDQKIVLSMADELDAARMESRFPNTSTSYRNAQAVLDDYEQYQALNGLERGTQKYNSLYVENARRIQDRDSEVVHDSHDAHVRHTVQNLLRNQDVGEDLSSLVRHAARSASANAVERALANNQQLIQADLVRDLSQSVIHTLADQGLVGDLGVNLEAILEDVFSTIEARILDATGPLRINTNRVRETADDLRNTNSDLRTHDAALDNHVNNLTTQIGALNTNVGAVSAHVNVLGSLAQVINGTATRTNAHVGQVSNDLQAIQQVLTMIPGLIQEALQQALPGAIQAALTMLATGSLQNANGKVPFMVTSEAIAPSQTEVTAEKNTKDSKKSKKRGFFARLFKRGGKKDGEDGAAN